jgi:small multidrug resistance pump
MKLSLGFTRLVPAALMFIFYGGCFGCLTMCIKRLDVSVAYAIWSGLGTAAIATIGICWFKEPLTALRLVGLILVLTGVAALQWSNPLH